MSWDDFKFGKNLPTFLGGTPGKSVLRSMAMEAGGMDGIRRVDRTDPDGTTHTLFTRNGMPTVITTAPRKRTISSRFHGLCRQLAVYVGLTDEITWQPANYLQPTDGNTRYFKAPGVATDPERTENPADYSKTIGDYVILVNGENYLPTDDTTALTNMQWLFEGEGNTVRVLGLTLKDFDATSHSFYVKDYGPFRKTTPSTPYVAQATLATITITSTDPYVATLPTAHPKGTYTRTGGFDDQVEHYGGAGFDPLDTELPDGWVGIPTHIRTSGEFQVQASPNGRQIAVMRGYVGLVDDYSAWHREKYCQAMMPSTILTVATVDISSAMVVSAPVDVFQWEYHFPDDFTGEATIRYTPAGYYASLGTWWIAYQLYNISSTGTPYTLKECIGFCYKADGSLKIDYVERDYGPVQTQAGSLAGPVEWMYLDSGVPGTGPEPATHLVAGDKITRTSYQINGGFGWGNLGYRSTLRDQPTDTTAVNQLPYYRLTNNVILLTEITKGPNFYELSPDGSHWQVAEYHIKNEVFTPTGRVSLDSLFPTVTTNSHFTTYNPETGVLASSNNGTGPICWV